MESGDVHSPSIEMGGGFHFRYSLSRELRHINLSTAKSFVGILAQIAKQRLLLAMLTI